MSLFNVKLPLGYAKNIHCYFILIKHVGSESLLLYKHITHLAHMHCKTKVGYQFGRLVKAFFPRHCVVQHNNDINILLVYRLTWYSNLTI